jgi:hypothetical protein
MNLDKLRSLPADLQIIRELSLLGNYEQSILYFEPLLLTLTQYSKSKPEQSQKWSLLIDKLTIELNIIKDIYQELNRFENKINNNPIEIYDKDVWPAPEPLPSSSRKLKNTSKGILIDVR